MGQPDYKRPFEQADFRGYFRWSQKLTDALGGTVHHACHESDLRTVLSSGELGLRSNWQLRLPGHGLWSAPGVWVGLNFYNAGNKHGPLLIQWPVDVLTGKHFMVFRRVGSRKRYFFVQYEARIPVYTFGEEGVKEGIKKWRQVDASTYFDEYKGGLGMKSGAIYDLVLTQPLPLSGCKIEAVSHPTCISGACRGMTLRRGRLVMQRIARDSMQGWMKTNDEFRAFMDRFPDADGMPMEVRHPDSISGDLELDLDEFGL